MTNKEMDPIHTFLRNNSEKSFVIDFQTPSYEVDAMWKTSFLWEVVFDLKLSNTTTSTKF